MFMFCCTSKPMRAQTLLRACNGASERSELGRVYAELSNFFRVNARPRSPVRRQSLPGERRQSSAGQAGKGGVAATGGATPALHRDTEQELQDKWDRSRHEREREEKVPTSPRAHRKSWQLRPVAWPRLAAGWPGRPVA